MKNKLLYLGAFHLIVAFMYGHILTRFTPNDNFFYIALSFICIFTISSGGCFGYWFAKNY